MKKICCEINDNDFIKVQGAGWVEGGYYSIDLYSDRGRIILSPAKIRKLRKQLKRALVKIEGISGEEKKDQDESSDWFSGGKTVKVTGNSSNHGFQIGEIVKITHIDSDCWAKSEYLDSHDYWWVKKSDCEPS